MNILRFLSFVSLLFSVTTVYCCSCAQDAFTRQDFDYNKFIFVGKVISFKALQEGEAKYGGTHMAEFLPHYVWKGLMEGERTISIECTPGDGCGEHYSEGEYHFICTGGHSSICDYGHRLSYDPSEPGFKEKLDESVEYLAESFHLDEMTIYYKQYGSLERYYSRERTVRLKVGQRIDYYEGEVPFGVDPDTVKTGWVLVDSYFYHSTQQNENDPDSVLSFFPGGELSVRHWYGKGERSEWTSYHEDGTYVGHGIYDEQGELVLEEIFLGDNQMWYFDEKTPYGYARQAYDQETGDLVRRTEPDSNGVTQIKLFRPGGAVYCTGTIRSEATSIRPNEEFFYIVDYYNIKGEKVVENGTGHFVEWHNDSIKAIEADVRDGIWYGHIVEWYDNGAMHSEEFYEWPTEFMVYNNSIIDELSDNMREKYGKPYGTHSVWRGKDSLWWESIYEPDGIHYTHNYLENGEWKQYSSKESIVYSR